MKNATYAERALKPSPVSQDRAARQAGHATRDLSPAPETAARHVVSDLPAEPGARALRQAAVLQMQSERGNVYVAQMVQTQPGERLVQRGTPVEPVEAVQAPVGEPSGAETTAGEPTPTEMTAGGSAVRVTPGGVEISGGTVNVDAPMTRFSGIVRSDTVIADSVVATNYTPGAGNVW